jgi:hypothetical protein
VSDERHPGDARDLDAIGDAPGSAPIVGIRDVLLFATGAQVTADDRAHPFAGEPAFELSRGARLERLAYKENELVMNACMPRGHFFFPVRQFGSMQALVLPVSDEQFQATRYGWDPDGTLHATRPSGRRASSITRTASSR